MGSHRYPLLLSHRPDDAVAWCETGTIPAQRFLQHVNALARRLPRARYAINLCEDRYLFLVAFAAAMVRGQTSLLPPNRTTQAIIDIASDSSYCLSDQPPAIGDMPTHRFAFAELEAGADDASMPVIDAAHLAAIMFTSGSTGTARPHPKQWGSLVLGTRLAQQRFGIGTARTRADIVATVPPQHMYGLETSILLPLIAGASLYRGAAFFPADVQKALQLASRPAVLVTTPVHLRACVESGLEWPAVEFVLSATAPLDRALAARAEMQFRSPVMEIFGCTEAGSLATRRTVTDTNWLLYEGSRLLFTDDRCAVQGRNLPEPVPLHDVIESVDAQRFRLVGRHADMLNIAGKRSSLEDLNLKLREIEHVQDGVFVLPEEDNHPVTRLAALVVAPALDESHLRRELARRIDPAFMPRPLLKVERLPRNATGKLPRRELLALLATFGKEF